MVVEHRDAEERLLARRDLQARTHSTHSTPVSINSRQVMWPTVGTDRNLAGCRGKARAAYHTIQVQLHTLL